MQLIFIKTPEMGEIPDNIKVLDDFGTETIIVGGGPKYVFGNAMYIEADPGHIWNWLHEHEVWSSVNPMCGDWECMTFAKERP